MAKTYWINDHKSSKSNFIRHLRNCVCVDVNDNLDDYVNEDYEAVTLFGHIFFPSELLYIDTDLKNKVYVEYVDKIYNGYLKDIDSGKFVATVDGTYFEIKEDE